jgi:hypothetical protein
MAEPRTPHRHRPRPGWRAAAVVALLAAVALVWWAMLHGPTGTDLAPRQTNTTILAISTSAGGGVDGQVLVGPSGRREGVPVGWRHDVAGAEASAAGYVSVTGAVARSGPLARRDMLQTLASRRFAPVLVEQVNGDLNKLLFALGERGANTAGMVWVEYPLAVRSEAAGPDTVRVSVWSVSVFGVRSGSVARQSWRTSELSLVWEDGDWKVDRWTASEGPAPAPPPETPPSTVAAIAETAGWLPVTGEGGGG